jgi:hypothetical protein
MNDAFSLEAPRAPKAPLTAPLYESHYLTAADPAGDRAVWIRYTSEKRPGEAPRGSLWCTYFGGNASPVARRTADARPLPEPEAGGWARIDGAEIGPAGASGELADCRWSVSWSAAAEPLPYLPATLLYDQRVPRSNGAALVPDATFDGTLTVAGATVAMTGWRGMVGHNWGSDHADRWVWLHTSGLGSRDPAGWLDLILARVRVGRWLTPWLPAGALQIDGRRHPIRATAARGLHLRIDGPRLELEIPRLEGGGLRVEADSPAERTATWDYPTPSGAVRDVRNCSVASARLVLGTSGACAIDGTLAVEIGT